MDARERLLFETRRHFFGRCGVGLGSIALASLLREGEAPASAKVSEADPLAPRPGHFPARAKSVIYLFMAGECPPAQMGKRIWAVAENDPCEFPGFTPARP